MKKALTLVLALAMVLALTACGNSATHEEEQDTEATETVETESDTDSEKQTFDFDALTYAQVLDENFVTLGIDKLTSVEPEIYDETDYYGYCYSRTNGGNFFIYEEPGGGNIQSIYFDVDDTASTEALQDFGYGMIAAIKGLESTLESFNSVGEQLGFSDDMSEIKTMQAIGESAGYSYSYDGEKFSFAAFPL